MSTRPHHRQKDATAFIAEKHGEVKRSLSLFDARIVNTETTLGLSVFLQDNRLAVAILGMGPVERECGKSWKKRSRRTSRVATV